MKAFKFLIFALKNNAEIAYEDAVEVIVDWLKESGIDNNSLPKVIYVSDEAKAYALSIVKDYLARQAAYWRDLKIGFTNWVEED